MRHVFHSMILLVLVGCTWIKLTDAGAGVRQATETDVAGCERVGVASTKTTRRVLLKRSSGQVQEELISLARNQAATLGGNAIVPTTYDDDGTRDFIVYRCP